MVVETVRDNLCVNKIVGQKSNVLNIEGDTIVPDIKPDILNIINTNGIVCVYKKEILDEKIRLDGCVNIYVIYQADNEISNIRSLNTTLDFTEVFNFPGVRSGMELDETVMIKSIDAKVLNGRKINLKVSLNVESKVHSNEDISVIKEISNIKNIQTLNNNINVQSLVGMGNTKVYAKDTLSIDNIDNLAEILKVDFNIVNKDMKTSYNKILAKADAKVRIMYLTEDDRINTIDGLIPIMGFVEIPNVSDTHSCDTNYKLKNLVVKPNNVDEHSIYIEAEIELSSRAYENKEVNIIQDLYSPNEDLNFTGKEINIMTQKETLKETCNIREKQSIPEISSNKIYDVEVLPIINNQNILNDKIIYEGEISINYLFANSMNGINTKMVNIPFTFTVNSDNLRVKTPVNTNIEIDTQDFVIISDGYIDVKIDLGFNIQIPRLQSLSVIDEIQIEENRTHNIYSMVIYFTKPGDTLWKIAKMFRSTIEDIARVNNIENINMIDVGMQLFIPKYTTRNVLV